MFIAYYFMWHAGHPAPEQCEGCTSVTSQVRELSYIHSRDVTYATSCQGPYEENARYRDFMGWEMPWQSAEDSLDTLLVGRRVGMMHIVCNLRQGSKPRGFKFSCDLAHWIPSASTSYEIRLFDFEAKPLQTRRMQTGVWQSETGALEKYGLVLHEILVR